MESMQSVLKDRLFVCQEDEYNRQQHSISTNPFNPQNICYAAYCDDFGPLDISSIMKFVRQLDAELSSSTRPLLWTVDSGPRNLTNAVFLLGAFLIIVKGFTLDRLDLIFSWAGDEVEHYRDATWSAPTFRLTIEDCWLGLLKGIEKGWISYDLKARDFDGEIDDAEYDHYDDPLNGDLHFVVPNKIIAFKGPVDLGDQLYRDNGQGFRKFSPTFYADLFHQLGVRTVVRLNEAEYDPKAFSRRRIAFCHLEFPDYSAPTADILAKFLHVVQCSPGLVAVHCKAGIGRTGVILALYLMHVEGFTAREAMAWLRIMRPGSVIGGQQEFLLKVEAAIHAITGPADPPPLHSAAAAAAAAPSSSQRAFSQPCVAEAPASCPSSPVPRQRKLTDPPPPPPSQGSASPLQLGVPAPLRRRGSQASSCSSAADPPTCASSSSSAGDGPPGSPLGAGARRGVASAAWYALRAPFGVKLPALR